jgi:hypothetical protein
LKCYTYVDAALHSVGLNLEKRLSLDPTLSKRLKQPFIASRAAKSRQEIYANKRHRPLEFEVSDHVYLKVSPMKGVKRFGMKGKLGPRYIGPFPILEKCETVAYMLDLPPSLARVHDIFHVSQ